MAKATRHGISLELANAIDQIRTRKGHAGSAALFRAALEALGKTQASMARLVKRRTMTHNRPRQRSGAWDQAGSARQGIVSVKIHNGIRPKG